MIVRIINKSQLYIYIERIDFLLSIINIKYYKYIINYIIIVSIINIINLKSRIFFYILHNSKLIKNLIHSIN